MHSEPIQPNGTRRFFLGPGLPIFLVAAVACYEAFLSAIIFAPDGGTGWAAFAREFRTWCFNDDPRTGGMSWSAVGVMALEPLFVAGVTLVLWRRALGTLVTAGAWAQQWRPALGGVLASAGAAAALLAVARPSNGDVMPPFPGERIRTQLTPPAFRFTDQMGRSCALADLRGRVVLITGIYAACSTSCPEILIQTRRLLEALPPSARERLTILALSLNPEYETTELMSALAAGYGFQHPEFRYLNADPATMHRVLEEFQFARVRNPATGVIEHANLLLLLDASGRIAFRFNLNPRHQAWLREAILTLTDEVSGFGRDRVAAK